MDKTAIQVEVRMVNVSPKTVNQEFVQHTYMEMVSKRIGQILCGYVDTNDCNQLRGDSALNVVQRLLCELFQAVSLCVRVCHGSQDEAHCFQGHLGGAVHHGLAHQADHAQRCVYHRE